jgi:hypothetical protein
MEVYAFHFLCLQEEQKTEQVMMERKITLRSFVSTLNVFLFHESSRFASSISSIAEDILFNWLDPF